MSSDMLKISKLNAQYTSPKIQNEVISLLGKHIRAKLVAEIEKAVLYAIMLDETPDAGHMEQASFVIRYVDQAGHPQEVFMGFVNDPDTTGASLAELIKAELADLGLSLATCRAQGYDGAAAMSGQCAVAKR